MNIPTNILALIFVLSFLIVFHEGGHFALAKLFRFPVEVFSLGFGKRLFGWKKNGTDYRVSLIPLGGYVKVVGLGPDESDVVAGTHAPEPAAGSRSCSRAPAGTWSSRSSSPPERSRSGSRCRSTRTRPRS